MIEPAVVAVRLAQYLGATVLFGSSLFFVYGLPRWREGSAAEARWARPLLAWAAAILTLSSLVGIGVQASVLAGSFRGGFATEALGAVALSMDLGKAALVRALAGAGALLLIAVLAPGRTSWLVTAGFGAVAAASLAWMGHGGAGEGARGAVHLAADIVHAVAASMWVGPLVVFLLLVGEATKRKSGLELHAALRRFSRVGLPVVALLVLSGLVNSWMLVGPDHVGQLAAIGYGRLLLVKVALFAGMVGLAARNRNRHTPALAAGLAEEQAGSLRPLRWSIALELALAFGVLAAVAWLGTLSPPGG